MTAFRVLGPIGAEIDGTEVPLGSPRERLVLAALLMDVNRPVQIPHLVTRVWGDDAPPTAAATLRSYVSRLRGRGVVIERPSAGYQLVSDPETVDLHRFRALVTRARAAADADASTLFAQALALWSGEAFHGAATPWFAAARTRLDLDHLAARLDHNDVRLRLGEHSRMVGELTELADQHPIDERVGAQLMLALYRCGRQSEALEHYQRTRTRLVAELGTEPGPALRRLHEQVLAAAPALDLTTRPRAVPRQLPAPLRAFRGRDDEFALIGQTPITVISGAGGMGKSWLALRWAHAHLAEFPDGQLFANLRGFDPAGPPVEPAVVVRGFLDALRIPAESVPAGVQAQAALLRELVADRRMLVVLDNALETAQVEPLLPGGDTCTVVITSRHQLGGMITKHGAVPVTLGALDDRQARDLFAGHLGAARTEAEPAAVDELVRYCAGLPLALGILAARAATRPAFSLAVLAEEVADVVTRLDAMDAGERPASLRAVFECSYRVLDPDAARVLGMLALAPGPDIGLTAAALLADRPPAAVRPVLAALEHANLVTQYLPNRYRLHDLVRLDVFERAANDIPEAERAAAFHRMMAFYLSASADAALAFTPGRELIERIPPLERPLPLDRATEWFDQQHQSLLAIQQGATDSPLYVWQLAWCLDPYLLRTGRVGEHLAAWRAGRAAGERLGVAEDLALASVLLGLACTRAGRHDEALHHLTDAVNRSSDDLHRAHAFSVRAAVREALGDDARGIADATEAMLIYARHGRTTWEAKALNGAGRLSARLGDLARARASCQRALEMFRACGDEEGVAEALNNLSFVALCGGEPEAAQRHAGEALELSLRLGFTAEENTARRRLAEIGTVAGTP
ncbi:MAG: hypothetical protein QOF58_2141 [Pseudonocardiales bacterium]|nr:hypothetical protein [Pseudonocardiales bacterium]